MFCMFQKHHDHMLIMIHREELGAAYKSLQDQLKPPRCELHISQITPVDV